MDSFIGWIGGKRLLRNEIIARFPKETPSRYIEVCGGAGWVMFKKDKIKNQIEVFNDIDSNLINLYRCIKYHPEAVKKELEYMLQSREMFFDLKDQINVRGLTDIQRAARYFYLIKFSFGCDKRTYATRPKTLANTLERFADVQERLNGVLIENRDFESLIKLYDSKDALFYVDPPYYGTEKYYDDNGSPFHQEDHKRLKECLSKIKGKFILSYNDDDFIRNLYSGYNIEGVTRDNSLVRNGKDNHKYAELIIRNYE